MKRKIVAMAAAAAMVMSMAVSAAETEMVSEYAYEPGDYSGVSIEMLNTKSEIQEQLVAAAEQWGELTGAELSVYTIGGDSSPSKEVSSRVAQGNLPALIMADVQDIVSICGEYGTDLSGEAWAGIGGTAYGYSQEDKLYSFPFCIEARGLMYNKTAIENALGEDWDPSSVKSLDDLKALLDRLVEGGMETPVALNQENWSLAGHYLTQVYEEEDGTLEGAETLISGLKDGSVDIAQNVRFNSLMDTFDVLMEYNCNKEDPLAADYALNAANLADGTVAFWYNGNWAWAEVSEYYEEGTELGIMPVVQNNTEGNENVNDWLCGSATKHVMIDSFFNDEKQVAAAKDFLNWLVFTQEGNDVLVNQCSLVPAFSNITIKATNGLAQSVQEYSAANKLFPGVIDYPGDHWESVGNIMQNYLGGSIDRAQFAKDINDYWTNYAAMNEGAEAQTE